MVFDNVFRCIKCNHRQALQQGVHDLQCRQCGGVVFRKVVQQREKTWIQAR